MKKKEEKFSYQKLFPLLIILATCFMGIGYASINSVTFDISGEVLANNQDGVFITDVNYNPSTGEDLNFNINGTTLDSSISLEEDVCESEKSLVVTFYNNSNSLYLFKEVIYAEELVEEMKEIYSNSNIKYTYDSVNNIIEPEEYMNITITFSFIDDTNCTLNNLEYILNFVFEKISVEEHYSYTGGVQTFTAPYTGTYKLEVWGAQGGEHNESCPGGYGGYSNGNIFLELGQEIYIVVGGAGTGNGTHTFQEGGYNGGGSATPDNDENTIQASGGGATHISINTNRGELYNYENNLEELLIIAGGGGGSAENSAVMCVISGSGGGNQGGDGQKYVEKTENMNGTAIGYGGTQSAAGGRLGEFEHTVLSAGSFGQGGSSVYSGGGGGLYGGGSMHSSSGGGSGYIGNLLLTNKSMYCYNCATSTDESTYTISTTNVSETPTSNFAKIGDGHAKITLIGK